MTFCWVFTLFENSELLTPVVDLGLRRAWALTLKQGTREEWGKMRDVMYLCAVEALGRVAGEDCWSEGFSLRG